MAVEIEGLNNLLENFKGFTDATKVAMASAMAVVEQDVVDEAKQNHTFQNRTGNLENSIQALPVQNEDDEIIGEVKAGMEYATYVEFGTSKMAPRPFLTTAIEANQKNLTETMASAVERSKQVVKVSI